MRITTCILLASLCAAGGASAAEFPAIEGWPASTEVQTYDRDGLWEYINGAADLFIAYGFVELSACNLRAGELEVTVNIYDMGNPLNAYGVYTTEASADAEAVQAGAGAVLSPPYQALLYKGPSYVKVDAYEGELAGAGAAELLQAIAAALPGDDSPPRALTELPAEGRVEGSEGYAREGFLGLAELADCVHATYSADDGSTYRVFMVVSSDAGADDTWQRLAKRWIAIDHPGAPVLARKVPYQGLAGVIRTDSGLVGVADCPSKALLLQRLDELSGAS